MVISDSDGPEERWLMEILCRLSEIEFSHLPSCLPSFPNRCYPGFPCGAMHFSFLDLAAGYWQVVLKEEDIMGPLPTTSRGIRSTFW